MLASLSQMRKPWVLFLVPHKSKTGSEATLPMRSLRHFVLKMVLPFKCHRIYPCVFAYVQFRCIVYLQNGTVISIV